jgi:hypothetical protein
MEAIAKNNYQTLFHGRLHVTIGIRYNCRDEPARLLLSQRMSPSRFIASAIVCIIAVTPLSAAEDFGTVVEPFLKQHCNRCHNEKMAEGELRIDLLSRDVASGPSGMKWAEIMERLSSGQMPPKKEPQPKADESAKIVEWLADQMKEGEAARLAKRERVTFNKLTRREYANTVRDLLGVQFDVADPTGLAEDDSYRGFERIGSVLSLSPSHVEKYMAAAEAILNEALPAKAPVKFLKKKGATELRGGPQELADKIRVDLWPGADLQGGRPGPGQALPASGEYKVRIQLSGLKPKDGRAPHLTVYATDLDRLLFEKDIIAAEDKPIVVEFTAHLPAGNINLRVTNDVPGPSNLPRSGRADPRIPFISIKDGRRPWQIKLTDDEGQPIWPFLIIDWIEWSGPIGADEPSYAQKEYLPADSKDKAQVRASLSKFAQHAFRRPLRDGEIDRFVKLAESEMASGEPFLAAYKTSMAAILCTKDFLYLVEGTAKANAVKLNDWELASRLSYFLWSTMPDESLMKAAESGRLHEPDVLRSQVRRMLADPKAKRFAESFPREWLQMQQVGMFPPDKKLYPDYDSSLERSMLAETSEFFGEVLKQNLSLREFLDSNWTMVNPRLARHYGMPELLEDRFQRVSLKSEDHRGGLLTQAAILSLTSDGTRHRPVHRGKWVLESMFGKSPPPPPANVKSIEPTAATAPKATLRMKLESHKSNINCASCHKRIDPLGLAFDNYDAIGRWRSEEVVSDGAGANPKVDASGELHDGRKFGGPEEFKKLMLADMDRFHAAFLEKLATFALRRTISINDRDAMAALAKAGKAADYKLATMVEELVLSELFLKR